MALNINKAGAYGNAGLGIDGFKTFLEPNSENIGELIMNGGTARIPKYLPEQTVGFVVTNIKTVVDWYKYWNGHPTIANPGDR